MISDEVKDQFIESLNRGMTRSEEESQCGEAPDMFRKHIREDDKFAERVDDAEVNANESVESALYQAAMGGNVTACLAWLQARMPERWKGKEEKVKAKLASSKVRAFDEVMDTPCPICLEMLKIGVIEPRAVMPLQKTLQQCEYCRDCSAAEVMALRDDSCHDFQRHRSTVAHERIQGLSMKLGMMEQFGLCKSGLIRPSSQDDLDAHSKWLENHSIPGAK